MIFCAVCCTYGTFLGLGPNNINNRYDEMQNTIMSITLPYLFGKISCWRITRVYDKLKGTNNPKPAYTKFMCIGKTKSQGVSAMPVSIIGNKTPLPNAVKCAIGFSCILLVCFKK